MLKCYKVVARYNNKLHSCTVPPDNSFCREYSTDTLTDMGLVFTKAGYAREFKGRFDELWKAEAAHLEDIHELSTEWDDAQKMQLFWEGKDRDYTMMPPQGTKLGFDIRLIKRVK